MDLNGFLLTSASRGPSAIAKFFVLCIIILVCKNSCLIDHFLALDEVPDYTERQSIRLDTIAIENRQAVCSSAAVIALFYKVGHN